MFAFFCFIYQEHPFDENGVNFCCPGTKIPQWFNHQTEGGSIHMDLPLHWFNSEFLGFALCIAIDGNQNCKCSPASNSAGICGWQVRFMCKSHFRTNNNESYETDYGVGSWGPPGGWRLPNDNRQLNSNHLFMFYNYPLHLQKKRIESSRSHQGHCPYPNSRQASFTLYISVKGNGDPCECWSVKKIGIRLLYASDAKKLGFVEEARFEIVTKHKRQRDEPESSRSKSLSSVEIEEDNEPHQKKMSIVDNSLYL